MSGWLTANRAAVRAVPLASIEGARRINASAQYPTPKKKTLNAAYFFFGM